MLRDDRPFAQELQACWEYAPATETPPTSCGCIKPSGKPLHLGNQEGSETSVHTFENHCHLAATLVRQRQGYVEEGTVRILDLEERESDDGFSNDISQALAHDTSGMLERFLDRNWDQAVVGEYSWIADLKEIGYTHGEIAELLYEKAHDSPWIYFERTDIKPALP